MPSKKRFRRAHEGWPITRLGLDLISATYLATAQLPRSEQYELRSQMRKAAVSTVSNIAEGAARGSERELRRFLLMARGSASELAIQAHICRRLSLLTHRQVDDILDPLDEFSLTLQAFINTIDKHLD